MSCCSSLTLCSALPAALQLYGLMLIGKLFGSSAEAQQRQDGSSSLPALMAPYQLDILAAVAVMTAYVSNPGQEKLDIVPAQQQQQLAAVDVGCCRFACHCCYLHDPLCEADLRAASTAAALALLCSGGEDINAADKDTLTLLHRLAAAGLASCLEAVVAVAGPRLNFLKRTKDGLNALQLARGGKHAAAAAVLEAGTESAAQVCGCGKG